MWWSCEVDENSVHSSSSKPCSDGLKLTFLLELFNNFKLWHWQVSKYNQLIVSRGLENSIFRMDNLKLISSIEGLNSEIWNHWWFHHKWHHTRDKMVQYVMPIQQNCALGYKWRHLRMAPHLTYLSASCKVVRPIDLQCKSVCTFGGRSRMARPGPQTRRRGWPGTRSTPFPSKSGSIRCLTLHFRTANFHCKWRLVLKFDEVTSWLNIILVSVWEHI